MPDLPSHNEIQKRAYELWEQSGKRHGYDMEFWIEAEREALVIRDIASRAVQMSAAERAAYIELCLALFRTVYEAKFRAPAPEVDPELAVHLQKWTEQTVASLLADREDEASSDVRDPGGRVA